MVPKKNLAISWEQFHRDTKTLTRILQSKGSWTRIVAITRGGLIPAAIIAKELNIKVIDTMCIASYTGRERNPLAILKNIEAQEEPVLFIDDLVDTGETARTIKQQFPHAHFAVVYVKPAGKPLVNSFVTEVDQDTWIVFPWDA